MNQLYENKIRAVLRLLEKSVLTEAETVEDLATQHLANVQKISDLEKKIQKLLSQKTEIEDANGVIEDSILDMIGNTKSQCLRFGKIIVDFKVTRNTGVTKSAPQYKNCFYKLVEVAKTEQKVVDKILAQFNNGGKEFTTVDKTLNITKESKQIMKESFSNWLKRIYISFRNVFNNLFMSFRAQNDQLEEMVNELKGL